MLQKFLYEGSISDQCKTAPNQKKKREKKKSRNNDNNKYTYP